MNAETPISTQELELGKSLPRALQPPRVQISAAQEPSCMHCKGDGVTKHPSESSYKHRYRTLPVYCLGSLLSDLWKIAFLWKSSLDWSITQHRKSSRKQLNDWSMCLLTTILLGSVVFVRSVWIDGKVARRSDFSSVGFRTTVVVLNNRSELFHTEVMTFPPSRLLQCKMLFTFPEKSSLGAFRNMALTWPLRSFKEQGANWSLPH